MDRPGWEAEQIPFYQHMGFTVREWSATGVVLAMAPLPGNQNVYGHIHGGAIAALLDAAVSQAVKAQLGPRDTMVTVDMTVQYIAPADGLLLGKGTVLRMGGSLANAEAVVHREDGTLAAKALATLKLFREREP